MTPEQNNLLPPFRYFRMERKYWNMFEVLYLKEPAVQIGGCPLGESNWAGCWPTKKEQDWDTDYYKF